MFLISISITKITIVEPLPHPIKISIKTSHTHFHILKPVLLQQSCQMNALAKVYLEEGDCCFQVQVIMVMESNVKKLLKGVAFDARQWPIDETKGYRIQIVQGFEIALTIKNEYHSIEQKSQTNIQSQQNLKANRSMKDLKVENDELSTEYSQLMTQNEELRRLMHDLKVQSLTKRDRQLQEMKEEKEKMSKLSKQMEQTTNKFIALINLVNEYGETNLCEAITHYLSLTPESLTRIPSINPKH